LFSESRRRCELADISCIAEASHKAGGLRRVARLPGVALGLVMAAVELAPTAGEAAGHEIEIRAAAYQKTRVAILGFTRSGQSDNGALTKSLSETLEFDLGHSGFFVTVPERTNAEVLVKADYAVSGGQITTECQVYDMAAGKAIFGRRLIGKESEARRVVHRMADVIVKELTKVDGIASTRIAFVADGGAKHKNVCLVDYDGKNIVQLTRDKSLSLAPDWSPEGKKIYYTSYIYGYPRVCSIELATGKRWVISAYPGLNAFPAISPQGNEMALSLSKDGCVEIYSASLEGKSPRRLTRSRGGVASSPCWSPNGTEIAFVSNRGGGAQIYVMNTDGSNVRRLSSGFSYVTSLDWSPRGNTIAFSTRYRGRLQIFIMDLDERTAKQVTFDSASHENPSFAPNGIHVVYMATSGYESDLYIVDTRESRPEPYRLTTLKGNETYPAWSPVGF
jgi:TolB protein